MESAPHLRSPLVIALATFAMVAPSLSCLGTDDGGASGGDRGAADLTVDRSRDAGNPGPSSDAGTSDGPSGGDAGDEDDQEASQDASQDPGGNGADPLSCELVDYGYGPIWDGPVSSASTGSEPAPMTGITEAHNAVRRYVGVADLSWSSTLAADAQAWADHLATDRDCDLEHDMSSDQGENLSNVFSSGSLQVRPQDVVGGWSCEREDWDNSAISCNGLSGFGEWPRSCGHYTQVVWETTAEVGCGVGYCELPGYSGQVWVCRYSPAGNWVGQRPYGD